MKFPRILCFFALLLGPAASQADPEQTPAAELEPKVVLQDPAVEDQDDMCFWIHPEDPALSTVITSDKAAGKLFVYGLSGETIQEIRVEGKPGNIDIRHGFSLSGEKVAVVGFNERDHSAIHLYVVQPETRTLKRADAGAIPTGPNYGFCLYQRKQDGALFAFTVSEEDGNGVEQYRLRDGGDGTIAAEGVRGWAHGKSEGCVADDETGQLYIGEEEKGIWKVGANPEDPTPGELLVPIGQHGLAEDVEGLTLLHGPEGKGYLVASSQGNSQFKVFQRQAPHEYVMTFTVRGVSDTDGVDLINMPLGEAFPRGVIAAHNGAVEPCPVVLMDLGALGIETYLGAFDPRK